MNSIVSYKKILSPQLNIAQWRGSGLLSPEEKENYDWKFDFTIQNCRAELIGITDIFWSLTITDSLSQTYYDNFEGWNNLLFIDCLKRINGGVRKTLLIEPYAQKSIIGYWKNRWTGGYSKKSDDYWKKYPEEYSIFKKIMEALHNHKVKFKILCADGEVVFTN